MAILPTNQLQSGQQQPSTGTSTTLPAGWQKMGGMMYNPSIQFPAGVTSGGQIQRDYLPNYVNIRPLPQTQAIQNALYMALRYGTPLPAGMTSHSLQAKGPGISRTAQFGGQPMNTTQPVPGYPTQLPNMQLPNTQFPTNNGAVPQLQQGQQNTVALRPYTGPQQSGGLGSVQNYYNVLSQRPGIRPNSVSQPMNTTQPVPGSPNIIPMRPTGQKSL